MKIPQDERGYKVDAEGVLHTRYATHAEGQRTRTAQGAESIGAVKPCRDCYPVPVRKSRKS